jgi:diketogulonate reductase-like aldo/keto reductase
MTATRLVENINVFDFTLDEADMKAIASMEMNHRFNYPPNNAFIF